MGVEEFVDFFAIIERYKVEHPDKKPPTNLTELKEFEKDCRSHGKDELAGWLENWRLNLEYHIGREFSE